MYSDGCYSIKAKVDPQGGTSILQMNMYIFYHLNQKYASLFIVETLNQVSMLQQVVIVS